MPKCKNLSDFFVGDSVIKSKKEHPVPHIDPDRCTGCGLCVKVCPTGTWAMRDGKAIVARPEACEYTGYCEWICPTQAIDRPFQIISIEKE